MGQVWDLPHASFIGAIAAGHQRVVGNVRRKSIPSKVWSTGPTPGTQLRVAIFVAVLSGFAGAQRGQKPWRVEHRSDEPARAKHRELSHGVWPGRGERCKPPACLSAVLCDEITARYSSRSLEQL